MSRRKLLPLLCSILLAAYVLCCGGCGTDSAQRIALAEAVVQQSEAAVKVLAEQVTTLQSQLAAAQAAGANSASLAAIRAALDDAMNRKPQVDALYAQAQTALEKAKANPTFSGEIELYGSILLSLMGVGLTGYFKRKATQANAGAAEAWDAHAAVVKRDAKTFDTLSVVTRAVEGLEEPHRSAVKQAVAALMVKVSPHNEVIDEAKRA